MTGERFPNDRVALHCGDCREVLATLSENSLDACVTDPPYHLTSIVKRFGAEDAAPARPFGRSNMQDKTWVDPQAKQFVRLTKGFMGQVWDGGDVAFRPETWAAVYRVLKPGAYIVAFGSSRNYHRMACAIEDAGFITHPMIGWITGQGFPKAHSVSKHIDRMAGAEREVVGQRKKLESYGPNEVCGDGPDHGGIQLITAPATDAAKQWDGWYYGTQSLKPALEPIYVGQKPFEKGLNGTENILKWGTGAINVNGCRIGLAEGDQKSEGGATPIHNRQRESDFALTAGNNRDGMGRWPANVVHDGSDEVVAAFPDNTHDAGTRTKRDFQGWKTSGELEPDPIVYNDGGGSAARFFFQAKQDFLCGLCCLPYDASCVANNAANSSQTRSILTGAFVHNDAPDLQAPESADKPNLLHDNAISVENHSSQCHPLKVDCAHESAQDLLLSRIVQNVRSAANLCSLCATDIARALAALRIRQSGESIQFKDFISGRNAPILIHHLALYVAGRESSDTILTIPSLKQLFGSVFHAIEMNTEVSVQNQNQAPEKFKRFWYGSKADQDSRLGSFHPTVKPLDLMQWLCRLVCPPGGKILDCFAGTGTLGEAAWREGMRAVLIEAEPEYQEDIRRRMALALAGPDERQRESIKAKNLPRDDGPLFGGSIAR